LSRAKIIPKNFCNSVIYKTPLMINPLHIFHKIRSPRGVAWLQRVWDLHSRSWVRVGHAPLVRAWDSRGFTPSPRPTKCAFRGGEVSSNPKKKYFTKLGLKYHVFLVSLDIPGLFYVILIFILFSLIVLDYDIIT